MIAYKYRGGYNFERDLTSIEESFFWASDIDSLNDPCEATFDTDKIKIELDTIVKLLGLANSKDVGQHLTGALDQFYKTTDLINKIGVFSLSKDNINDLLWAHYADSHKGFCVGYDIDILKSFAYTKHYPLDVSYTEKPSEFDMYDIMYLKQRGLNSFLQKMIGTKTDSWAYEKEIRIITDDFGKHMHDFRAIKSIYFGLRMPREQVELTMKRLSGRGIAYYTIVKGKNKFKLEAIPEEDICKDYPPYRYSISPVQEDPVSPQDLREEFKPYISYLYKAIEVHRRDPYCKEVCFATFSLTESKPNSPILFVNYINSEGLYLNKHYTLSEIDHIYNSITDL
ncbi:DUF2971 domain-containing protein [Hymenobacter sp. GOD-10R]|uniref:DUF2971 domain-containing protein n=1 Tax=Hymenobacter sp. GOD-10R TaxID=3093922 RepID=UPI002D79CF27|nr:DUF2971 domain-containing protein [Hymenobacter sp. GOD-10R]WRQ28134.1 DUF2971 domain-containing protein [Hymenobacter sp. GOD-10R]